MTARSQSAATVFTAIAVSLLMLAVGARLAYGDDAISPSWRLDAELSAVEFVDPDHGWAVGDRGVVWRTDDGGKVWHLVKTPVACRLETVSFADAERGWIAGGDAMSYVHTSRGVLLASTDGGRTWRNESRTDLPRIWKLALRGESGWAFGEPSPLHGDGVFSTRDGGRAWSTAVPNEPLPAWTAADAPRGNFAVVAAANGVYALAPAGRTTRAAGPRFPVSRPRSIRFADATDGWLCGDNGLLLQTTDGGQTWQDARGRIPDGAARHFDFHALEVRGRDIWLAGSPGTLVWHSTDAGETWTARPTGQTAPLKAIAFVDRHRGWAVGALGRILATRDGGHTWRVQLGSAERAALLGIHATQQDVPLAAYAHASGNDGYLATAIVMHEPYASTGTQSQDAQARRLHDAVVAVGGCAGIAASRFPLPEDGEYWSTKSLVAAWNQSCEAGDADALAQYEEYLVRQIRTWRPEAILTHDPANAAGRDTLAALVATVALNAAQRAADPKAYPQHLTQAALQPWRVHRIFGALGAGVTGPIELPPTKVAPRLGKSLGEAVATAAGQLNDSFEPQPSLAFRTLVDHAAASTNRRDFFSPVGRDDAIGGRRETDSVAPASLSAVQQRMTARRNAQGILTHAAKRQTSTLGWLGQLDALAKGLDDDGTAEVCRQLADQYESQGEWQQAAEAHRVIAQRYAKTPLGPPSLAWLIAYESSGEIALRRRANPGYAVRQASAERPLDATDVRGNANRPDDPPRSDDATSEASAARRLGPLLALVNQADARFTADARVRFPLVVAQRQVDAGPITRDADGAFASLADLRLGASWARAAEAERWLSTRRGKSPLPLWRCPAAAEKPFLDGKHDDPLWRDAGVLSLSDTTGAELRLAHDREFLYVAGRFPTAAGAQGTGDGSKARNDAAAARRGERDVDLSERDHLELSLDIDRDYVTAFTLAVDAEGRTQDRCGRDAAWNPQWFVATRIEADAWTVELAIPLSEFSRSPPESTAVWALSARRIQPGVGIGSATDHPALDGGPAAYGWLEFE